MGANLSYPAVDLGGKVALVTGANTGIGYETAKVLAGMGAHTFVTCRSREKAAACVESLKTDLSKEKEGLEARVEGLALELGSLRSARDCAGAFRAKNLPLHLLVNNAGVLTEHQTKTDDNHELMYQVNHLSPFLLTLELLPKLLETVEGGGEGRVVWVASLAHEEGQWTPNNLDAEVSFDAQAFYRNSKLYNVMTSFSMQRRLRDTGITVSSLHPGVIRSDLWRHMADSRNLMHNLFAKIGPYFMRSVKDGAATTINCAVNPRLNSGQCFYYSDCAPKQPTAIARNEQYQEELWDISIRAIQQYLSREVLERYGAAHLPTTAASSTGDEGNSSQSRVTGGGGGGGEGERQEDGGGGGEGEGKGEGGEGGGEGEGEGKGEGGEGEEQETSPKST